MKECPICDTPLADVEKLLEEEIMYGTCNKCGIKYEFTWHTFKVS